MDNPAGSSSDLVDHPEESGKQHGSRKAVHIADSSALHCKNGCGFFGNREWDGYCSICYKKHIRAQHQQTTNTADINNSNNNMTAKSKHPSHSQAMMASTLPIGGRTSTVNIEGGYSSPAIADEHSQLHYRQQLEQQQQVSTGHSSSTPDGSAILTNNTNTISSRKLSSASSLGVQTNSQQQQQQQSSPTSSPLSFRRSLIPDMLTRAQSATALTSQSSSILPGTYLSFRKFEEKKRQQQNEKKSVRSFFKRASFRDQRSASATTPPAAFSPSALSSHSPNIFDNSTTTSNNNRVLQMLNSTFERPLALTQQYTEEMISKLFRDSLSDIQNHVVKVSDKVNKMISTGANIEDLTETLSDFYETMKQRFTTNQLYKSLGDKIDELIDQTERLLMKRLYNKLFARVLSEEEDRDLKLQKKIRDLNWVMSSHLEVDLNLRNPMVKRLLENAITEIIEMDSKQIPYEKLQCVVKCATTIFEMLRVNQTCSKLLLNPSTAVTSPSSNAPSTPSPTNTNKNYNSTSAPTSPQPPPVAAISADEFLPALVFVIIKANPPLLQSNIKFITRFSTPSRVISGEAGYYFTNLCCATTFIEGITGKALNMSEDDFQCYMNGEAQPPGHYRQTFLIDAFQMLDSNISSLAEADERSTMLESEIQLFDDRFEQYCDDWRSKCLNELELTNLAIVGSANYKLFDEPIEPDMLPTYFRSVYAHQAEKRSFTTNGILIDIDGSPPPVQSPAPDTGTPAGEGQSKNELCDSLNGLTFGPEESPPLSEEVLTSGSEQTGSNTIDDDSTNRPKEDLSLPPSV